MKVQIVRLGVHIAKDDGQFSCKSTLGMGSKGGNFQKWKECSQGCWQMTNLGKYQKVQLVITASSGNSPANKDQWQPFSPVGGSTEMYCDCL